MWFADKLGSKPQAGAPAQKGASNGKAAPQQAPQRQQARSADTRSPPPAAPKKKGWF